MILLNGIFIIFRVCGSKLIVLYSSQFSCLLFLINLFISKFIGGLVFFHILGRRTKELRCMYIKRIQYNAKEKCYEKVEKMARFEEF